MPHDARARIDRLKKLAAELDAVKSAAEETIKHVAIATRPTDHLVVGDTRVVDTSGRASRKRRSPQPKKHR